MSPSSIKPLSRHAEDRRRRTQAGRLPARPAGRLAVRAGCWYNLVNQARYAG